MANEHPTSENSGRVIRLRPRASGTPSQLPPKGRPPEGPPPVGDIARYERSEPDDYRHRMIANTAAFVLCVFLILSGVWLAVKMAEMRKNQDCVLSGRRGCTPVEAPSRDRW